MADYDLIDVPGMDRKSYVLLDDGTYAKKVSMYGFDSDININSESNSVSTSGLVGKPTGGNGDFVTAYTAATQITFSSLPSYITNINTEDIISIFQINASGAVVKTYFRSDETITVAANVATIAGATFGATDTFVVFTSIERQNDVVDITGEYNATEPSLSDGDKLQLQLDSKGNLKTAGGASGVSGGGLSLYVLDSDNTMNQGKIVYTSASTCTLSALPFTATANLISKIDRFNNTGLLVETFTPKDTAMTISSNVLTISGMSASATDTFVLYILGIERTNDTSTNSQLTSNLNPVWSRYTDQETLITNGALTSTYAKAGADINMDGYTSINAGVVLVPGTSTTIKLRIMQKLADDSYIPIDSLSEITLTESKAYSFDIGAIQNIAFQVKDADAGTGTVSIYYNKVWR